MGCLYPVFPVHRLAKVFVCDSCTMLNRQRAAELKAEGDF